jgi:hypothetical protein
MEAYERVELWFHIFLTLALNRAERSASTSSPGKKHVFIA